MEIRLMKNAEVEQVKNLVFKTLSRQNNKKYVNSANNFTIVALVDDEVIGVATVFIHDDELMGEKNYFVSNLCVDSEYQRMGVATKIMTFIEELGKKNEIKYIYTLVPFKYYETNKLFEHLKYDIKNMNCYRKEL